MGNTGSRSNFDFRILVMEQIATITGYLVIIAGCVLAITFGTYFTIHRVIDAWGVRDKFLQMKRERDKAWKDLWEQTHE